MQTTSKIGKILVIALFQTILNIKYTLRGWSTINMKVAVVVVVYINETSESLRLQHRGFHIIANLVV